MIGEMIFKQLGAYKFIAMTGAKNLVTDNRSLSMAIGRNAAKITHVTIELSNSDTYTMKFHKVRGVKVELLAYREGVTVDALRSTFTSITGLAVSL